MAGLARGMRPGRRRSGRTGRPMWQGPHPADASKGAPPRARRRASQDQKHVATHACRMTRKNRPAASRGCDFRSRQTTEKPKPQEYEVLRRSSVFGRLRKSRTVQFCTGQTCTKARPGSGQKAATSVTMLVREVAEYEEPPLAQARPEGMQVHVRPDTGRKGAK